MSDPTTPAEPTRPRRRLALRWFIVAALLLVVGGGLVLAIPIYQEQRAAARLEANGGTVYWRYRASWLRPLVGPSKRPSPTRGTFLHTAHVVAIDLDGRAVGTIADDLRSMPNLRDLAIWRASIDGARFRFLQSLPELTDLSLAVMPLTDADLDTIGRLKKLRSLDLFGTNVTDEGLKSLAGLTQLESLRLDGTQVSDAGMRHLARLPKLRELSVSNTQVTDEGLKLLAGKLPDLAVSDD
jgi:hypothetical protein